MAHLRSYKSFNLQEIEEIESRIFGPTVQSENKLKGCPGSTNIPHVLYECNSATQRKKTEGAESWESVKDNIIRVLHHARYTDPMVVHVNQKFIDDNDLEKYEESNVCGIETKKSETWPRHLMSHEEKIESNPLLESATMPAEEKQKDSSRQRTSRWKWIIHTLSCAKIKKFKKRN